MRIKLNSAEAVKMYGLQREVMQAQEQLDAVNGAARDMIGEALVRSKKNPKEWENSKFTVKMEGPDVFLELVPEKKAP